MNFPTEDDLRSRVLMPFLQSLGIGPDRVRLEKTLRLRLGRTVVALDGASRDVLAGRLDVLVLDDDGHNLFVVEVKAENSELTDDDRDQGISYARLLHPMAPFVLVTNGRESKLFDTITIQPVLAEATRERLADWRRGSVLGTAEDLRLQYEALRHFLGYSQENVRAFCVEQQRRSLSTLRGIRKKYVPALQIDRTEIQDSIREFVRSDKVAFALVGESGVGKTCQMCSSAERLAQDHLVLFWNGAELVGSLVDAIQEEFSWHFSQDLSSAQIAERLSDIARATGRSVLILIDAIDESALHDAAREVSDLARRLSTHKGLIKVIFSLKTAEWPRFALLRGNPAPVMETLFAKAGDREPTDRPLTSSIPTPSAVLQKFGERERDDAITRYSQEFQIRAPFQGELRRSVADPLLLRLVCETFEGSNELPVDIDDETVLREYLADRIRKSSNPSDVENAIVATARALDAARDSAKEGDAAEDPTSPFVEEELILRADHRLTSNGLRDAISFGILRGMEDIRGRRWIGFTYDRVRDYIIAYRVMKLDTVPAAEFRSLLPKLLDNLKTRSAGIWYLSRASEEQWAVAIQLIRDRVGDFVETYSKSRSTLGRSAQECVDPRSRGSIGAIFDLDRHGRWTLGLFDHRAGQEKVVYRKGWLAEWWASRGDQSQFAFRVEKARSGNAFDIAQQPRQRAAQYFLEELRKAVHDGGLDESRSRILMLERVFGLAAANRDSLRLKGTAGEPALSAHRPSFGQDTLDVAAVRKVINVRFGEEFYKEEYTQTEFLKLREQALKEGRALGIVSISLGSDVLDRFRNRAALDASNGRRFAAPQGRGFPLTMLLEGLDTIRIRGGKIKRDYLPSSDLDSRDGTFEASYTDTQMARFLEHFFVITIKEYRRVCRESFGKLARGLKLYSTLPVVVLVEYSRPAREQANDFDNTGALVYSFVKTPRVSDTKADVRVEPSSGEFRSRLYAMSLGKQIDDKVKTRYGSGAIGVTHFSSFRAIMSPRRERPLQCGSHASPPHGLWIREWIYQLVEDDLKDLDGDGVLSLLDDVSTSRGFWGRLFDQVISMFYKPMTVSSRSS